MPDEPQSVVRRSNNGARVLGRGDPLARYLSFCEVQGRLSDLSHAGGEAGRPLPNCPRYRSRREPPAILVDDARARPLPWSARFSVGLRHCCPRKQHDKDRRSHEPSDPCSALRQKRREPASVCWPNPAKPSPSFPPLHVAQP